MTFDLFEGQRPKEDAPEAAAEPKPAHTNREHQLIEAVFSTPQGRELAAIWKDKLLYNPVWNFDKPESMCRHIGGRHSVYRDIITIAERK